MFMIRCLKLFAVIGLCAGAAACVHVEGSSAPPAQSVVVKPAGSCLTSNNDIVADSTVVHRCAIPGQSVTECPQYLCQRCTNGTWSNEYGCALR
ncbi:hypothetical protein [Paraburkholderia sp. J12]|uniref:hypothetical protein n=1 Tax=Paraburkholderia sp. J12 TaxID=2805432 RepID=UPI002ABD4797|nr:hypothetical protein [Paraburkholderia sp. J12]